MDKVTKRMMAVSLVFCLILLASTTIVFAETSEQKDCSLLSNLSLLSFNNDLRGSAKPLSYLQVCAVYSSNCPQWEWLENKLSSSEDHGGAKMYIVTKELGYGNRSIAQMNGRDLKLIKTEYISQYGEIIGYYFYWDASGYDGGTFTYENTSMNSPWNTMSDSIYIR